jgi:hypothetical protein
VLKDDYGTTLLFPLCHVYDHTYVVLLGPAFSRTVLREWTRSLACVTDVLRRCIMILRPHSRDERYDNE